MAQRVTNEEIIAAYRETGSVWKAAKIVGIGGQSIHERLRAMNYPMNNRRWDEEELNELKELAGNVPISEIAHRLGRTYAGIACKLGELDIATQKSSGWKVKVPRSSGYDKVSILKYIKEIDEQNLSIRQSAIANKLNIENLVQCFERFAPEWWENYRKTHSAMETRECIYCGKTFYPMSARAKYCTRKCGNHARTDESYFGGRRRETIGLAEGICQLCGRKDVKGLSSHHVLGKENDPDNSNLIALCPGCHKIITLLATRKFVLDSAAWESVIQLAVMRAYGHDKNIAAVYSCVEVELVTQEEFVDEEEEI